MIRHDDMLKTIIRTIENDYAGIDERTELNQPRQYVVACGQAHMDLKLDDLLFYQYMSQYLASLQDRNLSIQLRNTEEHPNTTPGFEVRRYRDYLYVTNVDEETRLAPGDAITLLNKSLPASHLEFAGRNIVYSDIIERQLWGDIVKMAKHGMVQHADGTTEDLVFEEYPAQEKEYEISCVLLDSDTLYMKLEHFTDPDAIERIIEENNAALGSCKKLIIDVRKNVGGIDEAFFPLLKFIHHEPINLTDLIGDEGVYTNYSVNNCDRRISQLEACLPVEDKETETWIREAIEELTAKSGAGYIFEEDEDLEELDFLVEGGSPEQKVVLITDTLCEGAGESFVSIAKKSQKVTVVGRPTMGTIDYCNQITVALNDDLVFSYPISKTKAAMDGRGVSGKGVGVDVYIPWTPEECTTDLLLKKAFEL